MMLNRRLLRGTLGTAVVWGVAAVPLTLVQLGVAALLGAELPPLRYFAPMLLGVALRGACSGAAFAGVLAFAARGRPLADLRAADMARWGALGAATFPAVSLALTAFLGAASPSLSMIGLAIVQTSLIGAGCGAATLVLARRHAPGTQLEPPTLDRPSLAGGMHA